MKKTFNLVIVSHLTLSALMSLGAHAAQTGRPPVAPILAKAESSPLVLSDDEAKDLRQIITESFRSGPNPFYSASQIDNINHLIQGGKPLPSYIQLYGPTEGENPNLAVFTLSETKGKRQVTLDTTVPAFVHDMKGDAKAEGRSKNAEGSEAPPIPPGGNRVTPTNPAPQAGSAH